MNESRLTDKARGFSLQTVVYSQSRKMVFYFISHCVYVYIIYCFLTFGNIMGCYVIKEELCKVRARFELSDETDSTLPRMLYIGSVTFRCINVTFNPQSSINQWDSVCTCKVPHLSHRRATKAQTRMRYPSDVMFYNVLAPEGGHPTWEELFIEKQYQNAKSFFLSHTRKQNPQNSKMLFQKLPV